MARGTTLVFKNHQQNGSFRSHQILKKKIPITSSLIVSCPWFLLFCFVLYHQSWRSTYTRVFKNINVFGLKNRGWLIHKSTYTRENTVYFLPQFIESRRRSKKKTRSRGQVKKRGTGEIGSTTEISIGTWGTWKTQSTGSGQTTGCNSHCCTQCSKPDWLLPCPAHCPQCCAAR